MNSTSISSRLLHIASESDKNSSGVLPRIAEHLKKLQKPNGSWQNRVARMREDDPLIATCFAIIALSETNKLSN